jgi:metallo-beta-lactamase family protein
VLARGGVVVVPAFAVGRAQLLLHLLARLKARRAIADVPVLLNSPMATNVRALFHEFRDDHRLTPAECDAMCTAARIVNTVEESKALNERSGPMIILAGSGMATGGRVVHHLKAFAPDPKNLILLTGFQAAGTRGAALAAGTESIKIHGQWVPVRAEVAQLKSTSSHADASQLVGWLKSGAAVPDRIFVTHGEPSAADALRQQLRRETNAEVTVPEHGEAYEFEGRAESVSGPLGTAAGSAHVEP